MQVKSIVYNWVGKLQEHFQAIDLPLPKYGAAKLIQSASNLNGNLPIFTIDVSIITHGEWEILQGKGSSKSQAKQNAAQQAYEFIQGSSKLGESIPVSENQVASPGDSSRHLPENTDTDEINSSQFSTIQQPLVYVMVDYDNIYLPETLVQQYPQFLFYVFKTRNNAKNIQPYEKYSNCHIIVPSVITPNATDHCLTWHTSRLFHEHKDRLDSQAVFIIVTGDSFGPAPEVFSNGVLACNIHELQSILSNLRSHLFRAQS